MSCKTFLLHIASRTCSWNLASLSQNTVYYGL